MKNKLFLLLCLPAVLMVTACGKNNDQPAVVDTGAITNTTTSANTCQSGSVYNPSYGCLPAQYGQPPGFNGNGNSQFQVMIPSSHYCSDNNGGFGYGAYGNSGNRCWNNGYSYHWQYSGGFYYYW
jgi:hypothetical protein